jgi:hypothetical protein
MNSSESRTFQWDVNPKFGKLEVYFPQDPEMDLVLENPIWFSSVEKEFSQISSGKWTAPFTWDHDIWTSYCSPVFDELRQFQGSLSIRISTNRLDTLLQDIKLQKADLADANMVIMTNNGILLGNNFGFPSRACHGSHCHPSDLKPIEQFLDESPHLAALSSFVNVTWSGIYRNMKKSNFHTKVAGVQYYNYIVPLTSHDFPAGWFMIVYIPRHVLFDKTDYQQMVATIVSACIVILAVGIALFVISKINGPLTTIRDGILGIFVSHQSALTAQVKPEDQIQLIKQQPKATKEKQHWSLITDIQELQVAFCRMQRVVTAFEKFVPTQTVKRILSGQSGAAELQVKHCKVGIFFSDIKDFAEMAENLSCEHLMRLLSQYFHAMTEVLNRFDGVIGGRHCFLLGQMEHDNYLSCSISAVYIIRQACTIA